MRGEKLIERGRPRRQRPDHAAAQPVQFYSDCPDGYSLLALPGASAPGAKGNTLFAVVQFEYTSRDAKDAKMYGKLPSQIAVLTLDQDRATGELKLLAYRTVDPAAAHGLWITCGASLSPWNSHLSSEEYEPDAVTIASNERFRAFSRNLYGDPDKARPYHYGHRPEVTVAADGRVRGSIEPITSVAAPARNAALPACQLSTTRVHIRIAIGTTNDQPRLMKSRKRGIWSRGNPTRPSLPASRSICTNTAT